MDLLKLGWYALVVVVRVWQIEQSEKWDALVARCRGHYSIQEPHWQPMSFGCKLCFYADSLWRWADFKLALRSAPKPPKTTRPCGCKDEE